VLTDSSKLGHGVLANYARLEEIKLLITDSAAPAAFISALQKRGIAYQLAVPNEADQSGARPSDNGLSDPSQPILNLW